MVELYIEGYKVDLREGTTIAFNYTSTDTEDPTAIKNTFSTTLTLDGTKNNNDIFGHIWRLDKTITNVEINPDGGVINNNGGLFVNFDATKRVNFQLINNGEVFESGYIQLTEVNVSNSNISYNITLYGGLGDFFYTLMYNEDSDKEKTLEDLYFGWKSNLEEENTSILGTWNRNFIANSWKNIQNNNSGTFESDITAIPVYNGEYPNFDSNKIVVDVINYSTYSQYLPNQIYSGADAESPYTYFRPYKGKYSLVEVPRSLVEWEAKEFRSQYQRTGLRFSSLFNAISNPVNNGGFKVVLDDKIKNTPYYKNSYVLMNVPDFEAGSTSNTNNNIEITTSVLSLPGETVQNSKTIASGIDVSYVNPKIDLDLQVDLDFPTQASTQQYINQYTHVEQDTEHMEDDYTNNYWSGMLMRATIYDSNSGAYLGTTDASLYTNTKQGNKNTPFGYMFGINGESYLVNNLLRTLNNGIYKDTPLSNIKVVNYEKTVLGSGDATANLKFESYLPAVSGNINIKLEVVWVDVRVGTYYSIQNEPTAWYIFPSVCTNNSTWFNFTYINDANLYSNKTNNIDFHYSGNITDSEPKVGSRNVTKKVIFGSTKSPYKYLVDFTKMFGLKYRYDVYSKTVYIDTRSTYYYDDVEPLTVDISKGIKINPTSNDNKWYKFSLETPETYAAVLYNKKNNLEYGAARINTDYDFNNSEKNLMDGNIYKNLIPYRLSSYFFKPNPPIPNVLLFPNYDYTLYDGTDSTYTITLTKQFALLNDYGTAYNDTNNRLCLFDSKNSFMEDVDNALVFFNGYETNSGFRITDDVDEMLEMNENPCYLLTQNSQLAVLNVDVPLFNKYYSGNSNTYTSSFDFVVPSQIFGGTNITYNENSTIYYQFWNNYMKDLYNKNTKLITVYCFIKDIPNEAMRKFYFFDNCYWVISKISNYTVGEKDPVQVELVKVNDLNNYIK